MSVCGWSVHWCKWSIKSLLLFYCCPFLHLSVNICFMCLGGQFEIYIYIYNCFIFNLDWSLNLMAFFVSSYSLVLKSLLTDISIATLALFWFSFAWNTIFYPLAFSVCMSLDQNWISCRQNIYGSYFISIQSVYVFWLFSPLTYKVTIDRYVIVAILLFFF